MKTCYCHRCNKSFHPLGIMRHLSSHKDKNESYRVTYANGDEWIFEPKQKTKVSTK